MTAMRLNYYQAAPEAMSGMFALDKASHSTSLPQSLRELVRILASQLNGCTFCVDLHSKDALAAGENPRRLMALSTWHESPFFSARERAALLWAETLTLIASRPAATEIYQQVAAEFSPQELTELTLTIATINAWNRFGVGFAVQPEIDE